MAESKPPLDPEVLLSYTPYVRALARELVFDASLARDVEQETWLAALQQAPRDPDAARGWLAAVARNLARKALRSDGRRRRREEEHAALAAPVPTPDEVLAREDLRRQVVALVNGLDEPYRGALVLRYLEGCDPHEVARRLGVPVETAKTRLKRGLELLRARLDRGKRGGREAWCLAFVQGFGLGPPGLAPLAALAASSIFASPSGGLALSVMKTTALVSVVFAAGVSLFVLVRDAESHTTPTKTAAVTPAEAPLAVNSAEALTAIAAAPGLRAAAQGDTDAEQDPANDLDIVTVTGRVTGPDGVPRGGAEVFLSRWHYDDRYPDGPLAAGRAAEDGTFTLTYRKSDPRLRVEAERSPMWRYVTVSTYASGYGPAWVDLDRHPAGTPVALALVPDRALRGRVVDLEGQPIAGVDVRVTMLGATPSGSLDGFIEDPLKGEPSAYLEPLSTHVIRATTNGDGRFELAGIGEERLVRLSLSGETVTTTSVEAVTRALDPAMPVNRGRRLLGTDLQLALRPTRPITGVVRDRVSGAPLAGVRVMSQLMAGDNYFNSAVRTTTGADGRFRLVGMPKGAGNELCIIPADDQPYLIDELNVPDPAGMGPVEVEVTLVRGVWITGRVTDVDGAPVYGRLHYFPMHSNPKAAALYSGRASYSLPGSAVAQHHYKTDADGRFRLVGLPGRGIVGVEAIGKYLRGHGAAEIGGLDEDGNLPAFGNPIFPSNRWPNMMCAIEPAEDAAEVTCDLVVDPGQTLTIELVDAAGESVEGCVVRGLITHFFDASPRDAQVAVENLGRHERRLLRIHHPSRNIGLATHVTLAEGPKRLVLGPCTTLTGRLVDEAGAGVGGVRLRAESGLHFDDPPTCESAADGTFRFECVLPGLAFTLVAQSPSLQDDVAILEADFELRGGAVDLGPLTVTLR